MHNLIPQFSLKLNRIAHKDFLENNCSFFNKINFFQRNFIRQLLEKRINKIGHCMYPICMVQELLVLIVVLQFHSLYRRLIWSHSTEWNVLASR